MKKRFSTVCLAAIVIFSSVAFSSCAEPFAYLCYDTDRTEFDTSLFYGNVKTMQGADPSLIYVEETEGDEDSGFYYAYVTGVSTINAWRTKDMTNWQYLGAVFRPNLDEFWGYLNFWAPSVLYDETDDCYYMYYSASWTEKGTSTHYISLAKSESPVGPFEEVKSNDAPLIDFSNMPEEHPLYDFRAPSSGYEDGYFAAIDAEPFVDPVDHQKYLLFTHDRSGGYNASSTYIMKLNDWDDPDYDSVTCISQCGYVTVGGTEKIAEGTVNEGPYMLYHDGLYYLTFSVNDYTSATYQVRQAVGRSPMGPFEKIAVEKGGAVITTDGLNIYTNSSGHHSFIWVGDELYIGYHSFLNDSDISEARKIKFDKVTFAVNPDGIPLLYTNGPTVTLQPLPSLISGYENKAFDAQITASNVSGDTYWLNDGTIRYHENSVVEECAFNEGKSKITLVWQDYVPVKAVMVYNSYVYETSFTKIDNIRLWTDTGVYETGALAFNYDIYAAVDYDCIFAGASVCIEFADRNVNRIEITVSESQGGNGFAIPEITVLGKGVKK